MARICPLLAPRQEHEEKEAWEDPPRDETSAGQEGEDDAPEAFEHVAHLPSPIEHVPNPRIRRCPWSPRRPTRAPSTRAPPARPSPRRGRAGRGRRRFSRSWPNWRPSRKRPPGLARSQARSRSWTRSLPSTRARWDGSATGSARWLGKEIAWRGSWACGRRLRGCVGPRTRCGAGSTSGARRSPWPMQSPPAPEPDSKQLAMALAKVDAVMDGQTQGRAWREYLLLDALGEVSEPRPARTPNGPWRGGFSPAWRRRRWTRRSGRFLRSEPFQLLGRELRRMAAEPVDSLRLLECMERYERTRLPSDARALADECMWLALAPAERRQTLCGKITTHYRNANLRVVLTETLLNRMIPERLPEYELVRDTVLGNPVRGESLSETRVAVRLIPDPSRLVLALEVTGEVASSTSSRSGPAMFQQHERIDLRRPKADADHDRGHPAVARRGRTGRQRHATAFAADHFRRHSAGRCVGAGGSAVAARHEAGGRASGGRAEDGGAGEVPDRPGGGCPAQRGLHAAEAADPRSDGEAFARAGADRREDDGRTADDAAAAGVASAARRAHAPADGPLGQPGQRPDPRDRAGEPRRADGTRRPHVHGAAVARADRRPAGPERAQRGNDQSTTTTSRSPSPPRTRCRSPATRAASASPCRSPG